jgi:hypothetical protein
MTCRKAHRAIGCCVSISGSIVPNDLMLSMNPIVHNLERGIASFHIFPRAFQTTLTLKNKSFSVPTNTSTNRSELLLRVLRTYTYTTHQPSSGMQRTGTAQEEPIWQKEKSTSSCLVQTNKQGVRESKSDPKPACSVIIIVVARIELTNHHAILCTCRGGDSGGRFDGECSDGEVIVFCIVVT